MARPRRPEPAPLQTNDVLITFIGTVAWAVALVVLLIVGLPGRDQWWLWVCVVGIVLGFFGMWYVPRIHRGRAAAAERRTADKD
jgi:amino acid transporter